MQKVNLRFNLGYLIDAASGTSSDIEFDYPQMVIDDIKFTPLNGRFRATRTGEGVLVQGEFYTEIPAECVRCLEDYTQPIKTDTAELFYYPPSLAPEGEFILGEDGFIDLGPLVRELSLLEMPMQPICKTDCKGLCPECGQNLNEGSCDCVVDDIDPRMAALKALLDPKE
jgi:uncharacterized protein